MEDNIRPWGNYEILSEGDTFKVKKITVNPTGKLSLQSHKYRSEVWTIVSGSAWVTIDNTTELYNQGDVIQIPVTTIHRIENRSDSPVIFIEVQYGTYFGEDDIVRYEDIYGRN